MFARSFRKLLAWTTLILAAGGCGGPPDAPPPAASPSARDVLERMARAYAEASSYADTGELRMQYDVGGQHVDVKESYALSFVRPNKLRLHIYQANVVCDAQRLWAVLLDLPGQVLSRPAPPRLSKYSLAIDPVLSGVLRGTANESVPLTLLLDDQALSRLLAQADKPALLATDVWDEQPCYRVRVPLRDDVLTLWIDTTSYVLRRIDFPVRKLAADIENNLKLSGLNERIEALTLTADLQGARFNEKIDEVAFQFEPPRGAKEVANFDVLPQPEPLSTLLGQAPQEFHFTTFEGQEFSRDALRGKVAVIEFWATWSPPSLEGLGALDRVAERFRGREQVVFLSVNIDAQPAAAAAGPPTPEAAPHEPDAEPRRPASDDQVRSVFTQARLKLPLARDRDDLATKVFLVERVPNRFILGPDGTVQDHEVGLNPKLETELPARIEKLLAGESLVDDARQRYAAQLAEFQAQFRPPVAGNGRVRAQIAPRSEPVSLRLRKAWSCRAVKTPGNVLVTAAADGSPRLLVLDGWDAVAEVNAAGELAARHELQLPQAPEPGLVTMLRTAVSAGGKRYFLGLAPGRQQTFLFDDSFQFLRAYPGPQAVSSDGISDVQLADLDGDGEPEMLVGYFGVVGVHDVLLSGQRRWGNRTLANVLSLAVTEPLPDGRRRLLAADERGGLLPLDDQGRDGPPLVVNNRFLRAVFAADLDGDGSAELCCLAPQQQDEDIAIGIDLRGRELWSYPLPPGAPEHGALQPVAWGPVLGTKVFQWVLAGPDGSIHILAADGTPIDRFHCGASIAGLGVAAFERPLLIVATSAGVDAWEVAGTR